MPRRLQVTRNKLPLALGLTVLVLALAGIGVGVSGLLGTPVPTPATSSPSTTVTLTSTVTTALSETVPGTISTATQTPTQTQTQTQTAWPVAACQTAQPTNGTTLVAFVDVEIDPVRRGTQQVLYVTVCSAGWGVEGVTVSGTITDATGVEEAFSGITNVSGLMSHTWQIAPGATPGTFTIVVQAVMLGYIDGWSTTSFSVTV